MANSYLCYMCSYTHIVPMCHIIDSKMFKESLVGIWWDIDEMFHEIFSTGIPKLILHDFKSVQNND